MNTTRVTSTLFESPRNAEDRSSENEGASNMIPLPLSPPPPPPIHWEDFNKILDWGFRDQRARAGGPTIAERVEADNVLEYWVQQYVQANPGRFGLKDLEGPFETGPDFKAKVRGYNEKVGVEVE